MFIIVEQHFEQNQQNGPYQGCPVQHMVREPLPTCQRLQSDLGDDFTRYKNDKNKQLQ